MRLARIHNLLPSFLLVMVGAWAGAGCSLSALAAPGVWVVALLSGGIAVSSCVFNDYFDLRVGRLTTCLVYLFFCVVERRHGFAGEGI
jgi:4-hydroxybenzoate polyprenyltransferase